MDSWGLNAEDAEMLAATRAVSFAASVCPFDVVLEGDSLNLIQALKKDQPNPSRLGHIIELVHHEATAYRSLEFSSSPRSGNSVAHIRHATGLSSCSCWLEEAPFFCVMLYYLMYALLFLVEFNGIFYFFY